MTFTRRWLERLLKVSMERETSARERALEKTIASYTQSNKRLRAEHAMEIKELHSTLNTLQESMDSLRTMIDAREKQIEKLEHDKEILQIDVKGLTSVNARLTKWVESLRTAESGPTAGTLKDQLHNIENSVTWEAT